MNPDKRSLTVLTINVWHGHVTRGVARIPLEPDGRRIQRKMILQTRIAQLSPDVILMQECRPEPSYSASIADALGYDVVYQPTNSGLRMGPFGFPRGGREGIAILARPRLRLRTLATRRMSGIGCNTRLFAIQLTELNYALVAEVVVAGQPVAIICTHLLYTLPDVPTLQTCWRELRERGVVDAPVPASVVKRTRRAIARRDRSMSRLSRLIAEMADHRPVMVGGDFNLEATAPPLQALMRANRLTHAIDASVAAPTWDPTGNGNVAFSTAPPRPDSARPSAYASAIRAHDIRPQRPDHILVDRRWLTVTAARIVLEPHTADEPCPSDHYGIVAEIRVDAMGRT